MEVPEVGVEPTRGHPHTILSRARLPVSPLRPANIKYKPLGASSQIKHVPRGAQHIRAGNPSGVNIILAQSQPLHKGRR